MPVKDGVKFRGRIHLRINQLTTKTVFISGMVIPEDWGCALSRYDRDRTRRRKEREKGMLRSRNALKEVSRVEVKTARWNRE